MSKNTVLILASVTLIIFSFLGWAILEYFGPMPLKQLLTGGKPLIWQISCGSLLGTIIGQIAWTIIKIPFFKKTREFFIELVKSWSLSWKEILFISVCAGVGEEILFRGAIQPFLGVFLTALLFVGLHGYLNPFNRPLLWYGIFMVAAISVLGLFADWVGLGTAISAHVVIDVVLLNRLSGGSSALSA